MPSYVRCYWKGWLGLLILFLAIAAFAPKLRFEAFITYAVLAWGSVMVINLYEGRKLISHLRAKHLKIWEHITSGPGFGPGGVNGLRCLAFVYGPEDFDDQQVKDLKLNYRRVVRFAVIVFFSFIPTFIGVALICGN
jgi:hypothetical protein